MQKYNYLNSVYYICKDAALKLYELYYNLNMTSMDSTNPILPVHIYATGKRAGFFASLKAIVADFPEANALGLRFAQRNIKARYRKSALGILWALLPALATASVWIFLNHSKVIQVQSTSGNYVLFAVTGTMLWTVFSGSVMQPINIVQENTSILAKINFPREALLLTAFYEVLFNSLVSLLIIAMELLYFQVPVGLTTFLFLPLLILLILMALCLGLIFLPVAVLFRDLQFLVPLALQFAMYLTPVVYVLPEQGISGIFLKLNPVSPVLTMARDFLLGNSNTVSGNTILLISVATISLLIIGLVLYRIAMEILIERMGS